jgi:hypothetical protein
MDAKLMAKIRLRYLARSPVRIFTATKFMPAPWGNEGNEGNGQEGP